MISDAVRLIGDELGVYIEQKPRTNFVSGNLLLYNVADLDQDQTGQFQDNILISLVNVEEESSLKNGRHFQKNPLTGGIDFKEPPVHVNIYLLFCATYDPTNPNTYELALLRLSSIIEFFQSKRVFTVRNSPNSQVATDPNIDPVDRNEIRLVLEQYTLTFEQLNHLWGSLGGKQVPHIMFKGRLVKIDAKVSQEAQLIEEIEENPIVIPPTK